MGKRELLIIVGFVVVGAVIYQFTAPPATGTSSFSFSGLFDEARREMRGNPGRAELVHTATLAAPDELREVRILGVGRGGVTVIGERRSDIEYTLTVASTGPDDETAKGYAERTVFLRDEVADSLVLRVDYPPEATQTASAIVRVPVRLTARVESATGVTMSDLAGAHLESVRGDVRLSNIAGSVTGAHQDGSVTISGARSVKMRLTRLRSRFEQVTDGLTLDVRDGECRVADSAGPVEVESLRAEVTLTAHRGPVTVRGNDGRVTLDRPQGESRVDMRRAEVEVTVGSRAPITVVTTDQTVRVLVTDAAFVLDAVSTEGRIQAGDVGLTPDTGDREQRLNHTFGRAGGARVTIRNTRGDVVVRK